MKIENSSRDAVRSPIITSPAELGGSGDIALNFRLTAIIIASALFMENLDATVLATAIPTMATDFGVKAPEMSVALTAYLLALGLFIPASGPTADRWGAKNVFRVAIVTFMVGSILCALSPNLFILGFARFFQGVGGAMMVPVGRLVLIRSVAKRDLVSASSWLLMPGLLGQISGPPLGGFIVTYIDWRWIFWINLPIGLLGIVMVSRFIPHQHESAPRLFDVRGFILAGTTLSAVLFGLEIAGRGDRLGVAAMLFSIGLFAGLLYVRHADRHAHPILDLKLLKASTFRLALIGGSLTRITAGAQPFLLPLMMQLAFGLKASESGLITLGTAIGTFTMKAFAPRILKRWGFRSSLCIIGVLGACSFAICGLFRPGWPIAAIFVVLVVSGFLMSFQFTAYNSIAYDEVDASRMSAATSFYSTFQQLTLSLGICIGAAVLRASMAIGGHESPAFNDFSAAFWVVTGISLCSLIANLRFDPKAGQEMSGSRA